VYFNVLCIDGQPIVIIVSTNLKVGEFLFSMPFFLNFARCLTD
jgi:hypothetical protein